MKPGSPKTAEVLSASRKRDPTARDSLFAFAYGELRSVAELQLRAERREHTLQPTELVHEAYLRLVGEREITARTSSRSPRRRSVASCWITRGGETARSAAARGNA